jgi:hypothetical protein
MRNLASAFLLLLVVACSNKPKDLIPQKQMGVLLAEMQIAEAYAANAFFKDTTAKKLTNSTGKNLDTLKLYISKALAKNNIDEKRYKSSLEYYKTQPIELDSIYAIALDTTAKMQNALQAKQ